MPIPHGFYPILLTFIGIICHLLRNFSVCQSHPGRTNFIFNTPIRVESGSDDPDYLGHLGHFFGGSSGSHPQTKLSGCDPDF